MRTPILARFALVLALAFVPVVATYGQVDADPRPADSDPDGAGGFPWLCLFTSVAALVGLYFVVRRREQATEAEYKAGRHPDVVWYCRACDRDVSGSTCPHCQAPNPFTHDAAELQAASRAKRNHHRSGRPRQTSNHPHES